MTTKIGDYEKMQAEFAELPVASQMVKISSYINNNEEDDETCPHDEHDHGICLECGRDIMDDLVAAAEFAADCREDR